MREAFECLASLCLFVLAYALASRCGPEPDPDRPTPIIRAWGQPDGCALVIVDDLMVCDALEHDDTRATCITAAVAGYNQCDHDR